MLRFGNRQQLSVKRISPTVIGANESPFGACGFLQERSAAMATDIVERPDLIIQAAADYDRLAQLFEQLVGSRLGQFSDMSRGKPCLLPDMLHFQIKKLRVNVASEGVGRARWD